MARALETYRRMRDFAATPEPSGAATKRQAGTRATKALSFVVQRHDARRLHYDFRLELDGVLVSWAVPKGPGTRIGDKRLAVHVEDHPLDYGRFEGTIPQGHYGAGEVAIWDRGTWRPVGDPHAGLRDGHLKFDLDGDRLRGRWVLVRMKPRDGDRAENWLLIRERAPAVGESPAVLPKPKEAAASRRESRVAPPDRARAKSKKRLRPPAHLAPELATSVERAPQGEGWISEVKFDGYRLLARVEGGKVRLDTRSGKDWTDRFPSIAAALTALDVDDAWIDGEAVAVDAKGRSSFGLLQKSLEAGDSTPIRFAVFDLPWIDGEDLRELPLTERRTRLAALLGKSPPPGIVYSQDLAGTPDELLAQVAKLGLEGIMLKRADSRYASRRTRDWLKLKSRPRDEFVIGGYTMPMGSRQGLGALLVGTFEDGKLVYRGRVGTGLDRAMLPVLAKRLAKLERKSPPFVEVPAYHPKGSTIRWVEPSLVAELDYAELTPQGLVRQGSFVGLREDKASADVGDPGTAKPSKAKAEASARKRASSAKSSSVVVAGVAITHADRAIAGEGTITKLDLVRYVERVADRLLPEIATRPVSLVRCPGGDISHCFYQRHEGETGHGARNGARSESKSKRADDPYLEIRDLHAVVAAVQNGAFEFHTWGSTLPRIDKPDRIVLDLDPDPSLPWKTFREACELTRALLDHLELTWFVKTTGGKGIHFVVPLEPKDGWDPVREAAQGMALKLAQAAPSLFVATMGKAARKGRVYVDWLRNGRGATAVAAYSPRSRPGLPVSMPIAWDALARDVRGDHFNVRNVPGIVARRRSDPWARYAETRQRITSAHRRALAR